MVKKWLITGGCGFIGTNLVKKLVNEGGHFIKVLDNLSVGTRQNLGRVCNFEEKDPTSENFYFSNSIFKSNNSKPTIAHLIVGDILNSDLAKKAAEGMDVIVHLAANAGVEQSVENPKRDMEVNVLGTFNMLEAARQNDVKRFIFASSGAPIGECEPPIHEEIVPHPVSPYGASKLAGEGYCSAFFKSYGLETVTLRFGNVFGPRSEQKQSVVAKFIKQALTGKPIAIYGDGKQTRDFIFIEDLVRAIRYCATVSGIGGEVFQIATGLETKVSELAERLFNILHEYGIRGVSINHAEPRIGDVRRNYSKTSKANDLLHWNTEFSLEEGLRHTARWFILNKQLEEK